jgi:hypothetical protein
MAYFVIFVGNMSFMMLNLAVLPRFYYAARDRKSFVPNLALKNR